MDARIQASPPLNHPGCGHAYSGDQGQSLQGDSPKRCSSEERDELGELPHHEVPLSHAPRLTRRSVDMVEEVSSAAAAAVHLAPCRAAAAARPLLTPLSTGHCPAPVQPSALACSAWRPSSSTSWRHRRRRSRQSPCRCGSCRGARAAAPSAASQALLAHTLLAPSAAQAMLMTSWVGAIMAAIGAAGWVWQGVGCGVAAALGPMPVVPLRGFGSCPA